MNSGGRTCPSAARVFSWSRLPPHLVTLRNGDKLEGTVEIQNPPQDFAGSVDNLGQGLFRIGYDTIEGKPEVSLWLSTWDRSQAEVVTMQRRWTEMLQHLFP